MLLWKQEQQKKKKKQKTRHGICKWIFSYHLSRFFLLLRLVLSLFPNVNINTWYQNIAHFIVKKRVTWEKNVEIYFFSLPRRFLLLWKANLWHRGDERWDDEYSHIGNLKYVHVFYGILQPSHNVRYDEYSGCKITLILIVCFASIIIAFIKREFISFESRVRLCVKTKKREKKAFASSHSDWNNEEVYPQILLASFNHGYDSDEQ